MTYDVVYRPAGNSSAPTLRVGAVAFPWQGESSGVGLAPWRLARLRVQAVEEWPYDSSEPVLNEIAEDEARRARQLLACPSWFGVAQDGSSEQYPFLVSIGLSGSTTFPAAQFDALHAEVEGVAEHMLGLDAANFAALLFVLDEAIADGTGEIEFLAG